VRVGGLKPGESKEVQFSITPTRRGRVIASFQGSSPDGLDENVESSFQVLQAMLAVKAVGPEVQPVGRNALYEVHVTNPGDAMTGATLVSIKIPKGLEVTSATQNAYREETRTLRWRITRVRPTDVVKLQFYAETVQDGPQTLDILAQADGIDTATSQHTTTVISRPNPIVTVVNEQELAQVGAPVTFKVTIVNAGSKAADDLQVRVALSDEMQAVDSADYSVADNEIVFPVQKLKSGEKVTLGFQATGTRPGEHRARVLVSCQELQQHLAFESSVY
jgi:hypothetical protein